MGERGLPRGESDLDNLAVQVPRTVLLDGTLMTAAEKDDRRLSVSVSLE